VATIVRLKGLGWAADAAPDARRDRRRIRRLIAGFFAVFCRVPFERRRQFFGGWIAKLEALRSGQGRRVLRLDERRWMGRRVDLLKSAQRNLRVNLRGLDVLVAEDLLDKTDVGPVLMHVGRHAVAKQMAGPAFTDAGAEGTAREREKGPSRLDPLFSTRLRT